MYMFMRNMHFFVLFLFVCLFSLLRAQVIMQKIKGFLMKDQEEWMGAPATNGVMSVEECQEFHRMWSAIQFAYCMPLSRGEVYIE